MHVKSETKFLNLQLRHVSIVPPSFSVQFSVFHFNFYFNWRWSFNDWNMSNHKIMSCFLLYSVFFGIEGSSGSDGEGEWSEMVRACVEEGWWVCFEKSIGVWSEGQEEARTTQVEKENKIVGSEKKDAMNRARLLLEWGKSLFTGINPNQNWIDWLILNLLSVQ